MAHDEERHSEKRDRFSDPGQPNVPRLHCQHQPTALSGLFVEWRLHANSSWLEHFDFVLLTEKYIAIVAAEKGAEKSGKRSVYV